MKRFLSVSLMTILGRPIERRTMVLGVWEEGNTHHAKFGLHRESTAACKMSDYLKLSNGDTKQKVTR
jgi:hypothetical protein